MLILLHVLPLLASARVSPLHAACHARAGENAEQNGASAHGSALAPDGSPRLATQEVVAAGSAFTLRAE